MSHPDARVATRVKGLQRQSLRGDAAQVIRAQIVSGDIKPDTLYAIGQIAEELKVSVTPVREALLDLAKDGLIEMVRNRGFRVRVLTDDDLEEILQIRLMLEPMALREITERKLISDLAPLRELCERTLAAARAADWIRVLAVDREFHLTILAYLGNARLSDIVGRLRDQSRLYGMGNGTSAEGFLASAQEHDDLLDAIETGRAHDAEELMGKHLRHARGIWAGIGEERRREG